MLRERTRVPRGTPASDRHASSRTDCLITSATIHAMLHMCRGAFLVAICIVAQAWPALPAQAQTYPSKPIRLIVPWPPGGGVDISARAIAPRLAEALGQPVVVDNRGGAAGMIGTDMAARAPADGYTILHGAAGPNAILPLINRNTPYGPLKEFAEVAHFANTVYVMVANPALTAKDIQGLIALALSRPGELTAGASGKATPAHISNELFRRAAGINMNPVFYKGSAGVVVDLLGGQINMAVITISPVLPHIKSGKLRALGVTSAKRSTQLPEVPTIAESGFPGFDVINWYGILVPARTPRPIITRLNREITRITGTPETRGRLISYGLEVISSSAEEFTAFRKADAAHWAKIIRDINLKQD